jgi:Ni,Fe-hydrogenase maturation factor
MKQPRSQKVVTVFGNEVYEPDSLAVRLVPELQKVLPEYEFQVMDPTETMEPPSDPWIILDVGMGIDEVVVIDNLSQLEQVKGQSVHDFDVYMELKLQEKLGKLPRIQLILVPEDVSVDQVLYKLLKLLAEI